ncbi:4-hydroxy-tetrahydrodipicolinate synthase [Cohnella thermotolerans]|uniref:4-hydroxy-tetrahydrodipicolinate synthase n=1 Tax=Cohnella thermotolerans TaxID=329858 RepID=UPI0003F9AF94|nr:4-hydroxy-tetrahydrodipicolinate synthase [Cohnella thermotolerans]
MMNASDLKGIIVPVVTPFRPDGELDLDSFRNYVDALLERDIQGIVVNGTTGESPTTSWEEVVLLAQVARERMKRRRRVPLIVGTGTNDTRYAARRTMLAGAAGADAALVVVPYYSRPSQEGIYEHFRAVSSVGVPVIVYEIPARTGVRLEVDTARSILALDGVIGMKDSSGGTELLKKLGPSPARPVLCGEDANFWAMLRAGAAGGILASANVRTSEFADVWRLRTEGRDAEAEKAFARLLPTIRLLFREPNPAPLKWLLARESLIASDTLRLPLVPITPALRADLERERTRT